MPRVMSDRGQELLERYPLFLRNDQTIQAICNCGADELDRLDAAIDVMARNLIPSTAYEHLHIYEMLLGLTPNPPGQTSEERKATITAFWLRIIMGGQGLEWERVAAIILGAGWAYSVSGVNNSELTVTIPYEAGSIRAGIAEVLLESITPATMTINVTYVEGFILDESLLDDDLL